VAPLNGRPRGDYGIDAPGVVRGLSIATALGVGLGLAGVLTGVATIGAWIVLGLGAFFGVSTALHLRYSRVSKLRERVRLVDHAALGPDAVVLDVGCGRGLLLTEAAARLAGGHAVGVDIWSAVDQSGNAPTAALGNARTEGVGDRVEVCTGDARHLPFASAAFDAVVSQFAIHNIRTVDGRHDALTEIDRVLRPGGRLVVLDLARTDEYRSVLARAGWTAIDRTTPRWGVFPPARYVIATKPG
jgi:SAM-dependent methyltransferase